MVAILGVREGFGALRLEIAIRRLVGTTKLAYLLRDTEKGYTGNHVGTSIEVV